ncbi:hypothetical protein IK5_06114 [Bacillus cereus VD154]|uniref:Uncharacterized protein n=1 Tax=Bacillus cereus VD154 TaxID=1053238 RepID=A0A9W5NZD5_BACCE|nr:hypothetical protein IK5_06114 [Bacillus cereus VD154]
MNNSYQQLTTNLEYLKLKQMTGVFAHPPEKGE